MLHWKQCGSWSGGFWRSQLIWIYTVYKRVDICMVSYCFGKWKFLNHRKVSANLYYQTSKFFFWQVHYGHLLVLGQVENFTISTRLTKYHGVLHQIKGNIFIYFLWAFFQYSSIFKSWTIKCKFISVFYTFILEKMLDCPKPCFLLEFEPRYVICNNVAFSQV